MQQTKRQGRATTYRDHKVPFKSSKQVKPKETSKNKNKKCQYSKEKKEQLVCFFRGIVVGCSVTTFSTGNYGHVGCCPAISDLDWLRGKRCLGLGARLSAPFGIQKDSRQSTNQIVATAHVLCINWQCGTEGACETTGGPRLNSLSEQQYTDCTASISKTSAFMGDLKIRHECL